MDPVEVDKIYARQQRRQEKKGRKEQPKGGKSGDSGKGSARLRGRPSDSPETRLSKSLTWLLRHQAQSQGINLRSDGYACVDEILNHPTLRELTFEVLQAIVKNDAKNRFHLLSEMDPKTGEVVWWIRANQGHTIKSVFLDLELIKSHADIPTGIAVHGTNDRAWESIKDQGLSKMSRNHIHLAQGVAGSGVISGMRSSSDILIFIDVQKALDAGIKFFLSANGVVLTEGDQRGFLSPDFFSRVENAQRVPLPGWDNGPEGVVPNALSTPDTSAAIGTDQEDSRQTKSVAVGVTRRDVAVQVTPSIEATLLELETKMDSATL